MLDSCQAFQGMEGFNGENYLFLYLYHILLCLGFYQQPRKPEFIGHLYNLQAMGTQLSLYFEINKKKKFCCGRILCCFQFQITSFEIA